MNRHFALLLFCLLPLAATASVEPLWSEQVAQSQPYPEPLDVFELALLPNGSAYFLGSAPPGNPGYASLRLDANGPHERSQFVDDQFLAPDSFPKIIASTNDRVLLRVEGRASAPSIYLVDLSGRVLWAQTWNANAARFLANGDLIMQASQQLLRLRGTDGAVLWSRNLLDLHPYAFGGAFELGGEVDTQIDLAGFLLIRETQLGPGRSLGFQCAFDPVNGALRWAQPFQQAATDSPGTLVGQPASVTADSIVQAWTQSVGSATEWVIQSRRRSDGVLRWTVHLPAPLVEQVLTLVSTETSVHVAVREQTKTFSVSALEASSGQLRWRQSWPDALQVELLEGANGSLLAALGERDAQGVYRTRFVNLRAGDGGAQWEFSTPEYRFDWQRHGNELLLATAPVLDSVSRARLEVRDAASGALLAAQDADLTGRIVRGYATGFVGDAACHAAIDAAGLVSLRCLGGLSGNARWTREIAPLAVGDVATSVQIGALAAGRVQLTVNFSRAVGPELLQLTRNIAVDGATGVVLWELPSEPYVLSNLATGDGGVFQTIFTCPTPPDCTDGVLQLRRHDGTDGAALWIRELAGPYTSQALASQGDTLVLWRYTGDNRGLFAGIDAQFGSDRWGTLPSTGTVLQPSALVTASGQVVVKQEPVAGASREIELRGLDPVTGNQRWLLRPSVTRTRSLRGMLSELPGDTALVTGVRNFSQDNRSVSGPWLAAVDAATGALRWERAPGVGRDSQRLVRAVRASDGGVRLVNQARTFDSWLERGALSSFAPDSGELGGEHLYVSAPASPQYQFGEFRIGATLADGSVLVENSQGRVDGFYIPSLQRWPAPVGPDGDVEVSVATPAPITALGPSTVVEVRVENRSGQAISDLRAGYIYTDTLHARFIDCIAVAGSSSCSEETTGRDDARVNLGPGAIALIRFEMFNTSFGPGALGVLGSGHFYVDTPYAFGDSDLGNNLVTVGVRMGGMSNGFE